MQPDLTVMIPARNEIFLQRTIEEVLTKRRGKTEVIVILDGYWPAPGIGDHPDVTLVHHAVSIGQRAATNEAARMSQAEFIMKLDAHCALDEGFDLKMISDCLDDWTLVPRMYNLHAFDWVCDKCGKRTYQGPETPCCDQPMRMEIVWRAKRNPTTDAMRFDRDLHFQYWPEFKRRPEQQGELVPTLSILGACWMMHRKRYWELDGMDEAHGSWGQMGTEIACKSWLSGGSLMVTKKTWFSHMFRTQTGFNFPYPAPDAGKARRHSHWLWTEGNWPKAKHDLKWLIDKFSPVPDWTPTPAAMPKTLTKGIIYYTDNHLDPEIASACRSQLLRCANGHKLVSVSLKPLAFGENHVFNGERGVLTMFRQIVAALEACETDLVFFCEHDVLYHPAHFDFIPPQADTFYYDENFWSLRASDGAALFYVKRSTSGLCAMRQTALAHYRRRVAKVEQNGWSLRMGHEVGHHRPERVDDTPGAGWRASNPGIDIRHGSNLTMNRWSLEQFRRQPKEWQWADEIPGWGRTKGRFREFLQEIVTRS